MSDDELARVRFVVGDIADLDALQAALADSQASHIVHLAGLQLPFCKADPPLGAKVNVLGTVHVFEAAKRLGLRQIAYASTAAVYGFSEEYPEGLLGHDAPLKPHSHYGVYKQANEGTAHVYYRDDGIRSVGLRPYVVYGPGRDQGMTSSPTKAMLAAAQGQPFHIPFGGRFDLQFADDVARAFIRAARTPFDGAEVFNLRGSVVRIAELVAAIEAAQPAAKGLISFDDKPLGFPEEMDNTPLIEALGELPYTSLQAGVDQTITTFKTALADKRLSV
jgi:nucleoside-diphosphate-sugar epimerase